MKRAVPPFGNEFVRLRLIRESDLGLTLEWRNGSREWFKTTAVITPEQHRQWFRKYLDRDDDFVFIVERGGEACGQAAVYDIDRSAGEAEVGRFLAAPVVQGHGILRAACAELLRFC